MEPAGEEGGRWVAARDLGLEAELDSWREERRAAATVRHALLPVGGRESTCEGGREERERERVRPPSVYERRESECR